MKPPITIIDAIGDPNILGDTLAPAQEAALRALYGLPMTEEQVAVVGRCAGAAWQAGEEYREAAFICGRRSGKSDKLASNVAIYEAFFRDHNLSPGETGVVLLLAQNMRQAKVVKGYIEGKIRKSPILQRHVVANRAQELELDNGITIAIHPSSFRSIRGLSVVCCICDEIAFWWTEDAYANPDTEVVRAARPAMATFPNAKLLMVSSPYTMSGVLWDAWRKRDQDTGTLVWHAPTRLMNPTVPQRFLDREKDRDPENYRREYQAEFTDAVSSFLSAEAIQACVVPGRTELEPDRKKHHYIAAIDAAFRGDRFTACIAHYDNDRDRVVVDALRGWQGSRSSPVRLTQEVIPELKALDKRYGFRVVHADQFGAEPLKELFTGAYLYFEEHPFTNASKADLYGRLRTKINERNIELLDHEDSLKELRGLELENLPGGTVRIGHAGHGRARDDYADAIALAVSEVGCGGRFSEGFRAAGKLESLKLLT
nr:hypothetical protein 2 [Pseudomonadaceae bacterium]BDD44423.1 hypothetical protein 7 [Pseudomonadaceae bacterium]